MIRLAHPGSSIHLRLIGLGIPTCASTQVRQATFTLRETNVPLSSNGTELTWAQTQRNSQNKTNVVPVTPKSYPGLLSNLYTWRGCNHTRIEDCESGPWIRWFCLLVVFVDIVPPLAPFAEPGLRRHSTPGHNDPSLSNTFHAEI